MVGFSFVFHNLGVAKCSAEETKYTDIPKDPVVLKMQRRSKFIVRSKITIAEWLAMVTPPALTQFSWVLQAFFPSKRASRRSKNTTA